MNIQQIQSIVDRIVEDMAFLGTQDTVDSVTLERLREYAVVYSELVRDFHHRLEVCQKLLQQGQIPQALLKAREEPDMRELLRALSFRELPRWIQICEELSLTRPGVINPDAATILDDIYPIRQVIEQLLRRQRCLVFSRASKRDRLAVVRKLSMLDSEDPLWLRDIQVLERARREDMADEIEEATREGDLAELLAIRQELLADNWISKPSPQLIVEMDRRIKPLVQNDARRQIASLTAQAQKAHDNGDEAAAREVVRKIQDICRNAELPQSDAALTPLKNVQEWLDKLEAERLAEQQWQQQCMELRKAIENRENSQSVKEKVVVLQSDPRGVPQELIVLTNLHLQALESSKRVRNRLYAAGIIAGVLLVIGISVFFVWHKKQKRAVNACCDQIQAVLDRQQWDSAGKMFDLVRKESPEIWDSPRMREMNARFMEGEKKRHDEETARRSRYLDALGKVANEGLDKPDMVALEEMGKLAKAPAEKEEVKSWRDKISQRQRELIEIDEQLRAEQEQKFQARYKDNVKALDELKAAVSANPVDEKVYAEKLLACRRALENAKALIPLTDVQNARLGELETGTDAAEELYKDNKRMKQDVAFRLKSIQLLYGDIDKLEEALKSFTATYPDHACSVGFSQALGQIAAIRSVVAWNAMMNNWQSPLLTKAAQAAARLRELEDYSAAYPESVMAEQVAQMTEYYKSASIAFPAGATELAGMNVVADAINRPVLKQLMLLRTNDEETYYYIKAEPNTIEGKVMSYTLWAVKDNEGNIKEKKIPASELPVGETFKTRAPISLLIQELNKDIEKFKASEWATFFLDMASKVYRRKNIDPCAQGQLLQLLLAQASQLAPVAGKKISRQVQALDSSRISDVNWLDNSGDDVEVSRAKAAKVMSDMADPAEYAGEIRKYLLSLDSMRRFSPVAIVTDTSQSIKLPGSFAHAYVLVSTPKPRMIKLTPGKDGYLHTDNDSLLMPGTILFISR